MSSCVRLAVINLDARVYSQSLLLDYYYYATAGGAKIWWKKYLTSMQITQFIIDIVIIYYAGSLSTPPICRDLLAHRFHVSSIPQVLHQDLLWYQLRCSLRSSPPHIIPLPLRRLLPPNVQAWSCQEGSGEGQGSVSLGLISIRGVNAAPSLHCPRCRHAAQPDITAVFHHLVAFSNLSPFLHHTRTHTTSHVPALCRDYSDCR